MNTYSAKYTKCVNGWVVMFNKEFAEQHPYAFKNRIACEDYIRKNIPGAVITRLHNQMETA